MRKITLSLVAALAIGFSANAQTPDVKIGAKGGLNISNLTNINNTSSLTSFHIGAVAEIFVNERFSIQPELLYSAQGTSVDIDEMTYVGLNKARLEMDTEMRVNYINVPIMAKYYLWEGLNVQVGPQFGFLTSAKAHINKMRVDGVKIDVPSSSNNESIKDQFKSFDFGVNFGAGYELPVGVFFDARYNIGISKVNKEGSDAARNGVFQLSVGYKF
ncbi:porin family protein [Myroides odoratimimus]|uniref:Outer membrane protein beta-barrel domain-containing protein n=1 Tax=Myroides odoratimimus TaxID=76832 RepID=A0AAI8C8W0_9FLAO|nr:porin family protein [Myroides odoratimimus]ALU28106.1 hypothetical protein AS202_19005 [Myroides odoratimimus]MCA4793678.1 PorT family protein [Myroides odoratimimus]MCA4820940.1 PorT family protein [Myroides odoratimimus]MDM1039488.1 PorT family protein [Myroides odoratimimus]MDM1053718.1 PorT family protein [Myroides odoratimimus]